MMHRSRVGGLIVAAVVVAGGLSGCATKGYVNRRLDELRYTTDSRLDSLGNSTEAALQRAESASQSATEARELALGRAGLEEVGSHTALFRFDSDELTPEAESMLNQAALEIQDHPEVIIDVYGFADPTGPDRYNLDLGQRRAMNVMRYLVDLTPGQLSKYAAVSYGERPLRGKEPSSGDNEQARRVVVSLIRRVPLGHTPASTS